jgi:hypothetical protein
MASPSNADIAPVQRTIPPIVWPILGSVLAWGFLCVVLPPSRQNFPLVDDWSYAHGAFRFARGEGIHYGNWGSMPQLGQWLWACPFVWVFGETHFALRLSTLVLSWLGLIAFYDLMRQEGIEACKAALAVGALAANPLFFLLQATFMTDIPSLSMALIALAFYGRALGRAHLGLLAMAFLAAILGAITRQTTVATCAAAALMLWRDETLRRRILWWIGVLGPGIVGVAVHFWFQKTRTDIIRMEIRPAEPPDLALLPYFLVHLCGLAILPVLATRVGKFNIFTLFMSILNGSWKRFGMAALRVAIGTRYWKTFGIAALLMTIGAGYWCTQGRLPLFGGIFPYSDGMITACGAYSGYLVPGERPILLGMTERTILTVLGCLGGAFLLAALFRRDWSIRSMGAISLFTIFQLGFILVAPDIWDRYALMLFPGALALVSANDAPSRRETLEPWRWSAGLAVAGLFGVISVALMHDWFAWNSARWELGRRAVAQRGIAPTDIEGGFEWNGWHTPPADGQSREWRNFFKSLDKVADTPRGLALLPTRVWFDHVTGRYALSFTPLAGAKVLDEEPYNQWLLPGERKFYLLEAPPDEGQAAQTTEK